jgi:asparagine synthase (glutamine-hydrolysing)
MCGITGIFDTRGKRPIDLAVLGRMNESQHHRGPDEGSVHVEEGLGLGHRRLSIIDISTGQQPIFNEDGSVVVIYNGEIYNYRELIPELTALGHVFKTKSDTEVIVHAWEAWGEDCVKRFRGMFAFALWDRNSERLFLARDRLAVKPLYYALLDDGTLLFGSELKSLLAHGGLKRDIDPLAVEEYFSLGYVAEPRCIFRQARKLPPAHTLCIRRGRPLPLPREYWDVRFTLANPIGIEDACVELNERLRTLVDLRLISEVPLGAFLSGGVDSSAVVATMAGLSKEPVNTCSIAFDDPAFDEAAYAQLVADRYRTRHFVETVHSDDFDLIDTLAALYDEPFADSSAIPTYRVCQLARKHVTVALSGDGGDESFGGYRRYRLHLIEERLRGALPQTLRAPLFGMLGRLYPKADWAPRMFRAKTTFEGMARSSVAGYFHSMSILREPMRDELFSSRFKAELAGYNAQEVFDRHAGRADTDDPLALIQYLDLKTYLVGDINTKVDRASMAHSLEVREPLMDHELVEWLATLPSSLKLRGQEGKHLLKKSMADKLPKEILYRPKDGLRGASRTLVPRPASRARPPCRVGLAFGRDRLVQPPLSRALDRCSSIRRARLQRALVDPSHVRGLPAQHGRCHSDRHRRSPRYRSQRVMTLRILHVLDHSLPLHSGYTFRTLAILREQRALGWETLHLTTPKQGAGTLMQDEVDGWTMHRTPNSGDHGLLTQMRLTRRRLNQLVQSTRPDVIHAHSPVLNALPSLWVARSQRVAFVYEMRASWEDAAVDHGFARSGGLRYRASRALESFALRHADQVTTICEGLRQDIAVRGVAEDRITVIPNAVDAARFTFGVAADPGLRSALGLDGATVLGFAGSFYRYEGLHLLIETAARMLPRHPELRVLLVGGGPEEDALKAQVAAAGLGTHVIFAGRVPHGKVQRYYELIDVLAYPRLPSRLTELVTPLKPLEAMAQGRMFVASDVGGHRELIRDRETGFLFRPDDAAALEAAVEALLAQRNIWPQIRSNARRFVETERTWAGSVARYGEVYRRAMSHRGRPRPAHA